MAECVLLSEPSEDTSPDFFPPGATTVKPCVNRNPNPDPNHERKIGALPPYLRGSAMLSDSVTDQRRSETQTLLRYLMMPGATRGDHCICAHSRAGEERDQHINRPKTNFLQVISQREHNQSERRMLGWVQACVADKNLGGVWC